MQDTQKDPRQPQGYRSDGTPITPWGDGNGPVETARPCCTGREQEPAAMASKAPLEVDGPTTATPGPFERYPDEMTRPSGRAA